MPQRFRATTPTTAAGPRRGERFNFYSHGLALLLSLAGACWMLPAALRAVDAPGVAAVAVYLCAQALAFAASSALHGSSGDAPAGLQRLDHCAIYALIAGTYTPFAVLAPAGLPWPWAVLLALWACVLAGTWREWAVQATRGPSVGLYAAMGWMAVAGAAPLAAGASVAACAWLLLGAAFYSAGTFFYRNRRGHVHAHGVWHLMVLGGAASHFASVALVLGAAAGR